MATQLKIATNQLIEAVRLGGVKRFLVVGGAGTLEVKPGITALQAGGIPEERTGHFRLGDDQLIIDEKGKSAISFEDFAVALLDEAEEPHHTKRRFSIGY
jgi:putative NADH-flavin reductase